jgi:hypothetical protein
MSKLFLMSSEEKNRILNLHENAILREKKYSKLLTEDEVSNSEYKGVPKSKIEAVQQALVDLGYDLGDFGPKENGVDGKFGEKTKAAVIKFQTEKGISPNKGVVGPKTAAALGVEPLTTGKQTTPSAGTETPSDGAETGAGSTPSSPFKTREEGNAFRKWLNDNYPKIAKERFKLDREGSHTNKYILNAFNTVIGKGTTYTWGKLYQAKTGGGTQPVQTQPDSLTQYIAPWYKYHFSLDSMDSTESSINRIPVANTKDCGQFVNNFSTKVGFVGNAWNAHDNDTIGPRIKTGYHGLDETQIKTVLNIFNAIRRAGGPQDKGPQTENIKNLNQQLIPNITASDLKVDDIVGIFYPSSPLFEKAFYEAAFSGFDEKTVPKGKGYFVKDATGKFQPGPNSLSKGKGFGMNTHVGIVGAIKDGIPMIFHNIKGVIHVDPYNKIVGGGKIMWIRRPAQ